jgi:hypothetical protein
MRKLKQSLRNSVYRLPLVGPSMLQAYRSSILLKKQLGARVRALRADHLPDPETVYWLDPERILRHTNYGGASVAPKDRVFHTERHKGTVQDGDWDHSSYNFEDLDVVQALRQRIEQGASWEQTEFHQRLARELRDKGRTSWNIGSQSELEERFRYLDRLTASIREHGFQLNHTVTLANETKGINADPVFSSEITVNIGRNGEYFFQDGRHRLAIAKILGIKKVPVKVLVRHKHWVEFRQFMRALASGASASSRTGELYQNPVHPDLQDIPSAHACEDRLTALTQAVGAGAGSLLDIGANLGFFCHGFEALGYDCYAVELLPQCAQAADRIRIAEGRKFKVITGDLFGAAAREPLRGRHFKIVLALNIFHHFLKQPDIFANFTAWLRDLQADIMLFEPHCSSEPQMSGSHVNFDEREFVEFILKNSVLKQAELIHRCEDGRPIYKLWR